MFWETAVKYLHSQNLLFDKLDDDVSSILFHILRGWTFNHLLFFNKKEKNNLLYLFYTTVKEQPMF